MGERYGACWCQGTTCSWPATQRETQSNCKRSRKKVKYLKEKRRKYPVLVKIILKHLIKILMISFKCIKFVMKHQNFICLKMHSCLDHLLPLSSPPHTYGRACSAVEHHRLREKKIKKKKSVHYRRGQWRYSHVINQANFSGRNKQDKSVLHWATIQINLEVKERRVYCEIK